MEQEMKILVTGGSGYLGSWVVRKLLDKGYLVHTTVRSLQNREKIAHLLKMQSETNRLHFFEADLTKPGSFAKAMEGCVGVIHTASPFFIRDIRDAEKDLIEPAVRGTENVLDTVNKTPSVKTVVLTSSIAAIMGDNADIHLTENGVFTETHWNTTSNKDHQPYSYSKTLAEKKAWEMAAKQDRWSLRVINPGFILGPSLSDRKDATSIDFMISMVRGKFAIGAPDLWFGLVDVRDAALAHILALERTKAQGRHILVSTSASIMQMADWIREEYPKLPLPRFTAPKFLVYIVGPIQHGITWKFISQNIGHPIRFDNSYSKKDLQIEYTDMKQTLIDHVKQILDRQLK